MQADALRLGPSAAGLRSLAGQRVLVVGAMAESAAVRALLRDAGARVMASTDVEMALALLRRFPFDVVVVEPELRLDIEAFLAALREHGGASAGARTLATVRR